MNDKLNGGDGFPDLSLKAVDGSELMLPGDGATDYQIVLFYRGSF